METTTLIRKKISIKTEDFFRTAKLLKELQITIVSNFTTPKRDYVLIEAKECVIDKLKIEFEKETNHPLIII
jgi:hypothetical protein